MSGVGRAARARRAGGGSADEADVFPWVIALIGIGAGLLLFFESTVPALAEQRALRAIEQQRADELEATHRAAAELRVRRAALTTDPEHVLVELDRLGVMPEALRGTPATADTPAPGSVR